MNKNFDYDSKPADVKFLQDVRKILESGTKDDRKYLDEAIKGILDLIELRREIKYEKCSMSDYKRVGNMDLRKQKRSTIED